MSNRRSARIRRSDNSGSSTPASEAFIRGCNDSAGPSRLRTVKVESPCEKVKSPPSPSHEEYIERKTLETVNPIKLEPDVDVKPFIDEKTAIENKPNVKREWQDESDDHVPSPSPVRALGFLDPYAHYDEYGVYPEMLRPRPKRGKLSNMKILQASDGHQRGDGEWPPWHPQWRNFVMISEEIRCDLCLGRVHWGCSGIGDVGTKVDDAWYCPDCVVHRDNNAVDQVPRAPRDKCVRPDCLRRRKAKTVVEDGDEARYEVAKLIGRRKLPKVGYRYLVRWAGWPLHECTWEPEANLNHDSDGNCPAIVDLLREFEEHNLPLDRPVVLLPEALRCWDPVSGHRTAFAW